ncbi:MAG TPA: glycosyltransferase family 2 protein [Deltaproteobacteria bacterium]|nr:glycosyltransferase family 2 protein [Deltaproteobacteria bacterium]
MNSAEAQRRASVADLSVVVPAFNEQERIATTLERMVSYLESRGMDFEVVVVNDGSTDATADIVSRAADDNGSIRLIDNEGNRGKGFSVRRGVLEARAPFILFSDADLSTPIEEIEKLMPCFDEGYDVVIGSRSLPESRIVVHQPFYRETMGRVFNLIVRLLLLGGYSDTQCGFKCFRREAAREIFGRSVLDGFAFDVEVLYLAERLGYSVKEVPIDWYNSPNTRVSALTDSVKMFMEVVKIRLRDYDVGAGQGPGRRRAR